MYIYMYVLRHLHVIVYMYIILLWDMYMYVLVCNFILVLGMRSGWRLRYGIKFYLSDPSMLKEDISRFVCVRGHNDVFGLI